MGESFDEDVLSNVEMQLQEIELLQAMFPGEDELTWHDPTLYLDAEEYVKSSGTTLLRQLTFDINLHIYCGEKQTACPMQVSIALPKSYPSSHPTVSVISNDLSRTAQSTLNTDLQSYIQHLEKGNLMVLDIITWLQENVCTYCDNTTCGEEQCQSSNDVEVLLSFMWLYMHHIYNKEKRKNIINWADELLLTGFSLPGKPGVVYIEGPTRNVEEYFERLRRLSWKRMSCKVKDTCAERKFVNFQELCFDVHGARDYHMDMGKFFIFLKEKELGHMFKELFGVEGQESK